MQRQCVFSGMRCAQVALLSSEVAHAKRQLYVPPTPYFAPVCLTAGGDGVDDREQSEESRTQLASGFAAVERQCQEKEGELARLAQQVAELSSADASRGVQQVRAYGQTWRVQPGATGLGAICTGNCTTKVLGNDVFVLRRRKSKLSS
jgi:hypothetical protein